MPPSFPLHRHAVESILSFTDCLRDLHAAVQVSQQWKLAVQSMAPAATSVSHCTPMDQLLQSKHSSLRRHVAHIARDRPESIDGGAATLATVCSSLQLSQLSLCFPQLQSCDLHLVPVASDAAASAFPFPPSLTFLRLSASASDLWDAEPAVGQAIWGAIADLHRLQSLDLTLPRWMASLSFGALESMATAAAGHAGSLRHLTLRSEGVLGLNQSQIDVLRGLSSLVSLVLMPDNPRLQSLLLAPGHRLQSLQRFCPAHDWSVGDAAAPEAHGSLPAELVGMTSLTHLRLRALTTRSSGYLLAFPALRILRLHCTTVEALEDSFIDGPGLRSCVHLTALEIAGMEISAAQLASAIHGMHALARLSVASSFRLFNLSFLELAPSLRTSLRSLQLQYCGSIRVAALDQMQRAPLHALEDVRLIDSFDESLTEDQARRFVTAIADAPHRSTWPRIRHVLISSQRRQLHVHWVRSP